MRNKITEWIDAQDFLAADVIRWTETAFDRKGQSKKYMTIGNRRVAVEVPEHDGKVQPGNDY